MEAPRLAGLVVETLPVAELRPNPRNPRDHDAVNLDAIKASLRRFGQVEPLVVNRRTGLLVGGHGRLLAMTQLGWTEAQVVHVDLSDREELALATALNRTAELATWNDAALASLLKETPSDLLEATGFDSADLDALLASIDDGAGPRAGNTDPDDVPEPPVETTTHLGDLWLLGEHRLLCGDSTNPRDVDLVMDGAKADLISTDPPYLVDYTGADRPGGVGKDWSDVYREVDIKDAALFFEALATSCDRVAKENAAWYWWHAHRRASLIDATWQRHGILLHQQIVWVKPAALHGFSFYPWQHEPCFFGWRQGHKPHHDGDNSHNVTSVWNLDWEGKARHDGSIHPTQKPVEVFARPMRKHTTAGAVCFEPFCGSGSQLIAGERERRSVRAIEISPVFVDQAVQRWERYTGRKAERRTS